MQKQPSKQTKKQTLRLGKHVMFISDFKPEDFYTVEELAYCKNRISSLAGRFSAKVAIKKVLQKEISWKEMNILASKTGQPIVNLANVSVSIAHDGDLVAAFAGENVQVGIDITPYQRIEELLGKKHAEKIIARVLTQQEQEEAKKDVQKLAEKWAGKEAVSKVLGTGFWQGISFHEIEILTSSGKVFVKLSGNALKLAEEKNLKTWKISIEKKSNAAFAFATATG